MLKKFRLCDLPWLNLKEKKKPNQQQSNMILPHYCTLLLHFFLLNLNIHLTYFHNKTP